MHIMGFSSSDNATEHDLKITTLLEGAWLAGTSINIKDVLKRK